MSCVVVEKVLIPSEASSMNEKTKSWIGKSVSVTLRSGVIATSVQGVLLELNESFVLIEHMGNKLKPMLIPFVSVLHMEPLAE